jgi:hypothetical protein
MAARATARGRREDDESSRNPGERDLAESTQSSTAGLTGGAEAETETPQSFIDFGRALQEQIAEALEPAIAEFRQQVEEAVRVHSERPSESDHGDESEARPAPETSQAEEQHVAQAETRDTERQADDTERQADARRGREDDQRSERARSDSGQPERRQGQGARQFARAERRPAPRRREPDAEAPRQRIGPRQVFEGRSAARVGRLRLARKWRDRGGSYQAIHAYTEILIRYPGQGVANAAAEELLDLADRLEDQGGFYTVLDILDRLERLL